MRDQSPEVEFPSSDEDNRPATEQSLLPQGNQVHDTLKADGFTQDKDIGSQSTASRVWKEGLFTMWVKPNPAGGKVLKRFAVCECRPGKCKE